MSYFPASYGNKQCTEYNIINQMLNTQQNKSNHAYWYESTVNQKILGIGNFHCQNLVLKNVCRVDVAQKYFNTKIYNITFAHYHYCIISFCTARACARPGVKFGRT